MTKINSPCRDCKRRFVGCHDECEEYKEYCAACERRRNERLKQRNLKDAINEVKKVGIKKNKKHFVFKED